MIADDWHGLYRQTWRGHICKASFVHPAKFARGLITRIYEHCAAEGWLHPGDTVLDPFGGVALGAFGAMRQGCTWIGCELEPGFVELGRQNIALWTDRYAARISGWGTATLLQGDSRELLPLVQAACAISSPPYADGCRQQGNEHHPERLEGAGQGIVVDYGPDPANLGNLPATQQGFSVAVSSPPYNLPMSQDHNGSRGGKRGTKPSEAGAFVKYGNTAGQLEGLPMTEEGFGLAVSSPPYAASRIPQQGGSNQENMRRPNDRERYGADPANLGNLPAGRFAAAISSPPYEATRAVTEQSGDISAIPERLGQYGAGSIERKVAEIADFWLSARAVVDQTFLALRPGAHAVWVVKRFVRGGSIVEFSQQWAQLCEAAGFRLVHWHRALLTEDRGSQFTLAGEVQPLITKHCSFFRRLAEKNGSPAIDWEDVICMERP